MKYRTRRTFIVTIATMVVFGVILFNEDMATPASEAVQTANQEAVKSPALVALDKLEVKGRAPKTNYDRDMFGGGWSSNEGCDTRNIILHRDLINPAVGEDCKIIAGMLKDPYTGKTIDFRRGASTSADVQIDHVVALSDAWQKGAQKLSYNRRVDLANDPLELLAVDGEANQQKSGSDAASWLPSNKLFRCQYVARQIAVKLKYELWVTNAERDAIRTVLTRCPGQALPSASD